MWKLIASADKNWAIGKENRLLVTIPSDMKLFQQMTMGQIVVMGRKTLESFPNGLPLAGRENVVLTRRKDYKVKNAVVVHDLDSLQSYLKEKKEEIYIIGGASVYRQLLPYCDTAYITRINHQYEADAYLPNLEQEEEWELVKKSEEQTYFDLEYIFTVYRRRNHAD